MESRRWINPSFRYYIYFGLMFLNNNTNACLMLCLSEAGGKVTDAEGNPLDFSKGKYLDYKRGIVVTTQKLIAKAFESGKRIH